MYRFLLPYIRDTHSRLLPPINIRALRPLAYTLSGLILISCGSTAPPADGPWAIQQAQLEQMDNWQMRGRINVVYNDESHTPRVLWRQAEGEYQIRLWGTFNAGATNIWGQPGMVSLEQDGRISTARRPEDLILEHVGYEFPVSNLEYWIRGIPAPDRRARMDFTDKGALREMEQSGWTVSYSDLRQYGNISLPREVDVTRKEDNVRLRFFGLNWSLASN